MNLVRRNQCRQRLPIISDGHSIARGPVLLQVGIRPPLFGGQWGRLPDSRAQPLPAARRCSPGYVQDMCMNAYWAEKGAGREKAGRQTDNQAGRQQAGRQSGWERMCLHAQGEWISLRGDDTARCRRRQELRTRQILYTLAYIHARTCRHTACICRAHSSAFIIHIQSAFMIHVHTNT